MLDIIINIKDIVKNLRSYCFVEGTIVRTSEGNKAIEEVQIGEYVYAKDEETGEITLKEVLDTSISESQHLITIKIGQDIIEATPNHCFWIEEKGWVEAGDLQVGDKVVLQEGKTLEVENIERKVLETPVKVYNLTVEGYHTYFIGEYGAWVHNTCGNDGNNFSVQVTDETISNAMRGAPLKTQQRRVSKPVIQNYVDRIFLGEINIPGIKVDGNHRYIASRIADIKIDTIPWSGGKPEKVVNWTDIILDTLDWGNR